MVKTFASIRFTIIIFSDSGSMIFYSAIVLHMLAFLQDGNVEPLLCQVFEYLSLSRYGRIRRRRMKRGKLTEMFAFRTCSSTIMQDRLSIVGQITFSIASLSRRPRFTSVVSALCAICRTCEAKTSHNIYVAAGIHQFLPWERVQNTTQARSMV